MAEPFDYLATRADADELIREFGQAGAIRRTTPGSGNPWDPAPERIIDHQCTLVDIEFTSSEIDGTLILQSDHTLLVGVSDLDIEPTEADQVVVAGSAMEIVNVSPVSPGGFVVVWQIQARS